MPTLILKRNGQKFDERQLDIKQPAVYVGFETEENLSIAYHEFRGSQLKLGTVDGKLYLDVLTKDKIIHLNGKPLFARVQIVDGDELLLGEYSVIFENVNSKANQRITDEKLDIIGEDEFGNVFHFEATPEKTGAKDSFEAPAEDDPKRTAFYEFEELDENKITVPPVEDEQLVETLQPVINHRQDIAAPANSAPEPRPVFQSSPTAASPGQEKTQHTSFGPQPFEVTAYSLLAIDGPYIGKQYPLKFGDTKIGRDNTLNDVIIRNNLEGVLDPSISRRHATISYRDGTFYVSDKRSKTRTFVNQIELSPTDEYPVREGDEIEIVSDQKSTILRIAANDNIDFAGPQKAGDWWLRNAARTARFAAIGLGAIALLAVLFTLLQNFSQGSAPDELKFFEETWYQTSQPALADASGATDFPVTDTQIALGNFGDDGHLCLAVVDGSGHLRVLDGVTKNQFWENDHLLVRSDIPIVLEDLNQNGLQDIIVVGHDGRLHAFDGKHGATIWMSPMIGQNISGSPVVADFDGDSLPDFFVATTDGQFHIGHSDVFQVQWKHAASGLSVNSTPSAATLNPNGQSDIVLGTEDGHVAFVDGLTGKVTRLLDFGDEIAKATGEATAIQRLRAPIGVVDLNGNGIADIVIGSNDGHYLALESSTLSNLWHEDLHSDYDFSGGQIAPAFGHMNGDDLIDAVLMSNQAIKVIAGTSDLKARKEILWEYYADSGDLFVSPPSMADLNHDGSYEVIVASQSGSLFIFNGQNGKMISQIHNESNPVLGGILVGDIGEDGNLDILTTRSDGNIYRVQTNSEYGANSLFWSQTFGTARRTNMATYQEPSTTTYTVIFAACASLSLALLGLNVTANRGREKRIYANRHA